MSKTSFEACMKYLKLLAKWKYGWIRIYLSCKIPRNFEIHFLEFPLAALFLVQGSRPLKTEKVGFPFGFRLTKVIIETKMSMNFVLHVDKCSVNKFMARFPNYHKNIPKLKKKNAPSVYVNKWQVNKFSTGQSHGP